jgi:diadenosine tetraphosphate (Ap4A) HIT family hydrolase
MDFELHPRLAADTAFVADWPLTRVLLMQDARYPWLVLVPRKAGSIEVIDLEPFERGILMEEVARASRAIQAVMPGAKLNIGALGNLVPQLHVHVLGRVPGDAAWPGPVWGQGAAVPYAPEALAQRLVLFRNC